MKIGIQYLHPAAKAPIYGSDEAAGMDLIAVEGWVVHPGERVLVRTGIAIELPPGFEAQVRPRSGLALKHGVTVLNAPGTIDSDYRGEIGVILINHGKQPYRVSKGDRVAQLVVAPVTRISGFTQGELSQTERAAGGFGSSGVN